MELKNISEHRPKNLIIDVPEEDAEALLKSGEFIKATMEKLILEKKKVKKEEKEEVEEEFKGE